MDTFLDYYSKYLKYKKKYILLKNTSADTSVDMIGSSTKSRTYLISDNQGLYHDRLREILNSNGFKEVSKQQVLATSSKHVDFFWMGQSNEEGNRFDKDLYQIKSTLKTLLWRDNSHMQGKDVITNKQQLYLNMNKYFPDICSKHMAKTFLLKNVRSIMPSTTPITSTTSTTEETISSSQSSNGTEENQVVYIVKPAGHGACAGVGVTVVTNDRELEEARTVLSKRFKNIIVSEYIQNPLLYEGKKCHIRMYILINSDLTWSFWEKGRVITANLKYKKGDWTNKDIHDTHVKSTSKDLYFPEDILPKNMYSNVYNQIKIILEAVAKIIKPHIRCYEESEYCCEVFGIDFMITDDYTVKLIEINAEAGYTMKDTKNEKFKAFCSDYFDWFYKESLIPLLFPTTNKNKNEDTISKKEGIISKSDNKVGKCVNNNEGIVNTVKDRTNTVKNKTTVVKERTYISALYHDEIFDEIMKGHGWVKKDVNEFPEYVDLIFCVSMSMINSNIKNYKDRNKFYNIKAKLGSFFYNEDYENNKYENSIYNKQNLYFNMKKYFPDIAKKYFAETVDFLSMKTTNNNVYMIKPVNSSGGVDIHVIKNDDELDKVKKILLPKYTQIIASKYITNPLLYDNKKFHMRVYFIILFNNNVVTYHIYLNNIIFTAKINSY